MLPIAAAGLISVPAAQAALTYSGNLSPVDPATWTSGTRVYIGYTADGSLALDNGSTLVTSYGYLGNNAGVNGIATITGAGSSWTGSGNRFIGYNGNGALYISNGGTISNATGFVGYNATSTSFAYVDGAGSKWTNSSNVEVALKGTGTLSITNGGAVTSNYAYIGEQAGSKGYAYVDGPGSSWTNGSTFYVGWSGTGRLAISNGGNVANTGASTFYIGLSTGSNGSAAVNGLGSQLSSAGQLVIGSGTSGKGALSISSGGAVTASALSLNSLSRLTVDVGNGSSLAIGGGTGTLTNNGAIRLVAGAGAANGTFTPISTGAWSGSGTVETLGGTWDAANHTVTVSSAAAGAAGSVLTADLSTTQRFLFTDGASGRSVGAAFQATTSPSSLTLTASATSSSELTALQSLLGTGQAVLSAWDFTTEGYTAGNPVYLSLFAGSGQNLSNLNIWHYDGSAWSKFDASDLAYDNTYASFTATGLSGYALSGTAPVPIPAAAWLLGSGLIGLVGARRKFFA